MTSTPEQRQQYYRTWKAKNPDSYKRSSARTSRQKIDRYKIDPEFREKVKAVTKARYQAKKDEINARRRASGADKEYNAKYNRSPERREKLRRLALSQYGLTPEQYESMRVAQGGVCAVCGKEETSRDRWSSEIKNLRVDHCHETGVVRGLLCSNCNKGLGFLGDNLEGLERAVAYLRKCNG